MAVVDDYLNKPAAKIVQNMGIAQTLRGKHELCSNHASSLKQGHLTFDDTTQRQPFAALYHQRIRQAFHGT
jgi:hypothetical protein